MQGEFEVHQEMMPQTELTDMTPLMTNGQEWPI